jgi:hypothetical protein
MSRKGPEKPAKPSPAELRQQRLAEALRANLKRRKAAGQNRGENSSGKPEDDGD